MLPTYCVTVTSVLRRLATSVAARQASSMVDEHAQGLAGLTIGVFESRRSDEFSRLIMKQGGVPLGAPSIVEAPLSFGPELAAFVTALRSGNLDGLVVLTGAGQRKLVDLIAPAMTSEELASKLRSILVAARGPKAVFACRELGIKPQVTADAPHTWQDLLRALLAHTSLPGKRLALQQYGAPHVALTQALEAAGAIVSQVPVYRWQLPADLGPIQRTIDAIVAGEVAAVLFTAGPQAGMLFEVARRCGKEADLRGGLERCAVGSIGPSCTEALHSLELVPDFEPIHGKMGQLVLLAAQKVRGVLTSKKR